MATLKVLTVCSNQTGNNNTIYICMICSPYYMDYISKVLLSINYDTPAMFNAERHFLSGGFGVQ